MVPSFSRTFRKPVANAWDACAAVAVTGMDRPSGLTLPGARPAAFNARETPAMVARVGPKTEANCPLAR